MRSACAGNARRHTRAAARRPQRIRSGRSGRSTFFNGFLDFTPGFPPGEDSIIRPQLVATGTVLGHCYSPLVTISRRKAHVATSLRRHFCALLAAGLVLRPEVWVAASQITRYSSVGSMLGTASWRCPSSACVIFTEVAARSRLRHFRGRLLNLISSTAKIFDTRLRAGAEKSANRLFEDLASLISSNDLRNGVTSS